MEEREIRDIVSQLESKNSLEREQVWAKLRPLEDAVVPYLLDGYQAMKMYEGRNACVYYSMRYSRISETAFQLGILALNDRAALVRHHACELLAYSLKEAAIPYLEKLLTHKNNKTVADATAAIDSIKQKNHHFFIDRNHSGQSFLIVNPGDRDASH
ncbi:hypothetical protein FACS1894191_4390 [Clostridia bacterium]|nr:hypothetical protein FACS1894191_4390 [Clostridia bacterium]